MTYQITAKLNSTDHVSLAKVYTSVNVIARRQEKVSVSMARFACFGTSCGYQAESLRCRDKDPTQTEL